jgi:hypothetical protein
MRVTEFVTIPYLLKCVIACDDPAIPPQSGVANR